MNTYRVSWFIDIDAETPREAAEKALEIQRDPESIATVFEVARHADDTGHHLEDSWSFDLEEDDEGNTLDDHWNDDPWAPRPNPVNDLHWETR